MLPNRVTLSKVATDKLRHIKGMTGVTPNILARIAIMLAVKDENNLENASVSDAHGQVLNRDVLFGEHTQVYQVLIDQYVHETGNTNPPHEIIAGLIEAGVHKMGHIKTLVDLVNLKDNE